MNQEQQDGMHRAIGALVDELERLAVPQQDAARYMLGVVEGMAFLDPKTRSLAAFLAWASTVRGAE